MIDKKVLEFKKTPIRSKFVNGRTPVKFSVEGFVIDSEEIRLALQETCNTFFSLGEFIVLVYIGENTDYLAFRGFTAAMDFIKLNVQI